MILARVEGHAAVQAMAFGAPLHADETGAVIESEARAQNFVEHVYEARVGEHAAEGVAPRVLEGERVLAELAATLTTLQLGRVAGQAWLSIGDEIGVMLDGGVGGGDFSMGENVLEYEVAVEVEEELLAVIHGLTFSTACSYKYQEIDLAHKHPTN